MASYTCGFVVLSLFVVIFGKNLPSFVPICRRSNPNFNECAKNASVVLRPYFAKGIPELNIPSFEPLTIPMVKLEQGTGAINYKLKLTDVKIFGLSNFKFTHMDVDLPKYKIDGRLELPSISLESDYMIDGRALLIPVKGNGLFRANLTDVKAHADLQGDAVKRKGQLYWRIMDSKVNLAVGGAFAHFGNLFGGDSALGDATNAFLNQNAKEIIEEVKPAIEVVVGMIADDIANNFLRVAPFDTIVPP